MNIVLDALANPQRQQHHAARAAGAAAASGVAGSLLSRWRAASPAAFTPALLHPACADSDFMLHNRQLLPMLPNPQLASSTYAPSRGAASLPSELDCLFAERGDATGLAAARAAAATAHPSASEAADARKRELSAPIASP